MKSVKTYKDRVFKLEASVYEALCVNIGSPRSLACYLLFRAGEFNQLLELADIAPASLDPHRYRDDRLVSLAMTKNPRLPLSVDRKGVALAKWHVAEEQCKQTNDVIDAYMHGRFLPEPRVRLAVELARKCATRILGEMPTLDDLRFAEENMRFGPGASTSITKVVTLGRKFESKKLELTPSLLSYACLQLPWRRYVAEFSPVTSSRMAFVPKNAKVDRIIALEPDLNIYVQLGFGALLRKKLRASGLHLEHTQERHRKWMQTAASRRYATIDLSSASDCVSKGAVAFLLGPHWYDALEFSRTPATRLPNGSTVVLQKFSSMGNGYTFELETVVFVSIVQAVLRVSGFPARLGRDFSVYGDDIICRQEVYPLLRDTLNFFGFKVNDRKSFWQGDFRESCGADTFDGVDVRPFYLRSESRDFTTVCYTIANQITAWASKACAGMGRDSRLLPAWLRCFRAVPRADALIVPAGYGDVGFAADVDDAPSRSRPRRYVGYGSGPVFLYRKGREKCTGRYQLGMLLANLAGSSTTGATEALRGTRQGSSYDVGHVLTWPKLGPWI